MIPYALALVLFISEASLQSLAASVGQQAGDCLLSSSLRQAVDAIADDHLLESTALIQVGIDVVPGNLSHDNAQLPSVQHSTKASLLAVEDHGTFLGLPYIERFKVMTGWGTLAWSFVAWTFGWLFLFYMLSCTKPCWLKAESPLPHENQRHYCARGLLSMIQASFVAVLGVPAAISLLFANDYVQFAASTDVSQCAFDSHDKRLQPFNTAEIAVGLASLAAITFMVADVLILLVHRLFGVDDAVHHVAFISLGIILRFNCILPFNGACLLATQASTPFLNYVLLYRHRSGYQISTTVASVCFLINFLVFRVGLGIYATVILWSKGDKSVPERVPEWQVWYMPVAITLCVLVQVVWIPGLFRQFKKRLTELLSESKEEPDKPATAFQGRAVRGSGPVAVA